MFVTALEVSSSLSGVVGFVCRMLCRGVHRNIAIHVHEPRTSALCGLLNPFLAAPKDLLERIPVVERWDYTYGGADEGLMTTVGPPALTHSNELV